MELSMRWTVVICIMYCSCLIPAQDTSANHVGNLFSNLLSALSFGKRDRLTEQNRQSTSNFVSGNGLRRPYAVVPADGEWIVPRTAVENRFIETPLSLLKNKFIDAANADWGPGILNRRFSVPGGTLYIRSGRSEPSGRVPPLISEDQFNIIQNVRGLQNTCIQIQFCKSNGQCQVQSHNCPIGGVGPDILPTPPGVLPTPPIGWPTPPIGWPTPPGGWPTPPGGWPTPPGGWQILPDGRPTPPGGWPTPPGGWPTPPGGWPTPPVGWPTPPGGWPFPPNVRPTPPTIGQPGKAILCVTGGLIKDILCAGQCQFKQQGTGYCRNDVCMCIPIPKSYK